MILYLHNLFSVVSVKSVEAGALSVVIDGRSWDGVVDDVSLVELGVALVGTHLQFKQSPNSLVCGLIHVIHNELRTKMNGIKLQTQTAYGM